MNKFDRTNRRQTIIFGCLSALAALFIWSFSLRGSEASRNQSIFIAALLGSLLNIGSRVAEETFHYFIRKAAHFTEFMLLGLCLGIFSRSLGRWKDRRYVALPLLLTLSVAVTDEFIQYFTNRGSSVTDVVLDFVGGLAGLGLIALICRIRKRIEKERGF